jgi:hypothetical protein
MGTWIIIVVLLLWGIVSVVVSHRSHRPAKRHILPPAPLSRWRAIVVWQARPIGSGVLRATRSNAIFDRRYVPAYCPVCICFSKGQEGNSLSERVMISRNATLILAELITTQFKRRSEHGSRHIVNAVKLYDWLYVCEYEPYFLNAARRLESHEARAITDLIMRLHTGESIQIATPKWSWEQRKQLGNRILVNLAEDILRYTSNESNLAYKTEDYALDTRKHLIHLLELCGYVYRDNKLLFSESDVLDVEAEEGVLERLMAELHLPDLATPKHHLAQTSVQYDAGNWDACISDARKVLESVLSQVARVHGERIGNSPLSSDDLTRPVKVREYLKAENLLEEKEKRALAENYGLLSNTGGHPYIAEKDQARLMRHLALTFTQFVLLRLQGAMRNAGVTV